MAKLAVDGVGKRFDGLEVLRAVSFAVDEGAVVAVIGSSGCGKTTLLRILHGLIDVDEGEVRVDGRPVSGPGYDRGLVFQHSGLFPWRSTLANVEFGLELKGVPAIQRREVARRYLDLVGLTGFERHFPHQLSGGMQQRVGLARALAIDPDVLLMDEPFAALDAQTKEVLQSELLRIHRETRKTILFVTHDLDEAVVLADRVIVLAPRPGRIFEEVPVDLPRPRGDLLVLKETESFRRLRTTIGRALRAAAADEGAVAPA